MTTSPFVGILKQIQDGVSPETFVGDLVLVAVDSYGYTDSTRRSYCRNGIDKGTFLMITKAHVLPNNTRSNMRNAVTFEVLYKDSAIWLTPDNLLKVTPNNTLNGATIVITGALSYTRDIYKMIIECCGGKFSNSLSKSTDYLICGESVGATKMNKAKAFGTKLLTEKAFNAMVVV